MPWSLLNRREIAHALPKNPAPPGGHRFRVIRESSLDPSGHVPRYGGSAAELEGWWPRHGRPRPRRPLDSIGCRVGKGGSPPRCAGTGDNRQDGADRGKEPVELGGRGSRPYLGAETPCAPSSQTDLPWSPPVIRDQFKGWSIASLARLPPRRTRRHQIASGHMASWTGRRLRRVECVPAQALGRTRHVLSSLPRLLAALMAFRRWRQAGSEEIESRSHDRGCCGGPGFVSRFSLGAAFLMLAPSQYSFASAYSLRRIGSCGCSPFVVRLHGAVNVGATSRPERKSSTARSAMFTAGWRRGAKQRRRELVGCC
jgi:hypothetical protein